MENEETVSIHLRVPRSLYNRLKQEVRLTTEQTGYDISIGQVVRRCLEDNMVDDLHRVTRRTDR